MTSEGGSNVQNTEPESNRDLFSFKVFLVAAGIVGAAFLGLTTWLNRGDFGSGNGSLQQAQSAPVDVVEQTAEKAPSRLSQGGQVLLTTSTSPAKIQGTDAIATGDYATAIEAFESARTADMADPETLIYLNNARIGDQEAHSLAVVAPLKADPVVAANLLRGVAQAQAEINQAGGIQEKPLRVFVADDQGDVAIAQQIATELSELPDVIGVIGHGIANTANAAGKVYANAALPFVSTSVDTNLAISPLLANDLPIADALGFYMAKLNHRTAILFYDGNSDHSLAFKANFEEALKVHNGTMTAEVNLAALPDSAPTPTPEAEIFVLSPGDSPLKTATESIEIIPNDQVDHFYRHVFGGQELFSPDVLNLFGSMATGTILAVPETIYQSAASPFSDQPQTLWGKPVDWTTAASYNATQTVINGLKQAPTRQSVQQAIDNNTDNTVRLVRIRINPDIQTGYELLSIGTMTKDGFKPD